MNFFIAQRPRARLDLIEQFTYFAEREGVTLAERYLAAVDATFVHLAEHPRSGVAYNSGVAALEGVRRFPVRGFENYLIFYSLQKRSIDVIRVLHGARDIDNLFAREEG